MKPVELSQIKILNRSELGLWWSVRGVVNGKFVSVDVPKSRLVGLDEKQVEDQMRRALRAGMIYARPD